MLTHCRSTAIPSLPELKGKARARAFVALILGCRGSVVPGVCLLWVWVGVIWVSW